MKIYHLALLLLVQFLVACNESLDFKGSSPVPGREKAGTAKIVFRSADDGQTWQDISKGLPGNLREDSIRGSFFANDKGLFVRVGNERYHSTPTATPPFWTKTIFPGSQLRFFGEHSSDATGKSGIIANNYWNVNLKKANGTSVWSPIFDNSSEPRIRSVFETAGGTIFIGTDKGFFKTDNSGKTWKHVYTEGWAGNMAESNGVLVSTSKRRIIRSTDNGENWALAISEDSVAFDVKPIKGGFAAITSNAQSNTPSTSRLSTSYDGGKTWQPTEDKVFIESMWRTWDDRPRVQAFQTSIIQVGENLFSTHPHGIFRSSDKGKTWELLLPAVKGKVFNLLVSGNVIYAIPSKGGC